MSATLAVPDCHEAVIEPRFPRTEYKRLTFYSDPINRPRARMLWAARDASAEWARACAAQDWQAIAEATVRLAVFDKAYEMNQAQWPYRASQETSKWQDETDAYASIAFVYAARILRDAGHLDRMPRRSVVLTFCRKALDLCAEPLVDNGPVHIALLNEVPPPPAVEGDLIGHQLAQYDPVVRHARQLSEPLEGESAVFVYDARRGAYVLEDEAVVGVPDLTSDTSD